MPELDKPVEEKTLLHIPTVHSHHLNSVSILLTSAEELDLVKKLVQHLCPGDKAEIAKLIIDDLARHPD